MTRSSMSYRIAGQVLFDRRLGDRPSELLDIARHGRRFHMVESDAAIVTPLEELRLPPAYAIACMILWGEKFDEPAPGGLT